MTRSSNCAAPCPSRRLPGSKPYSGSRAFHQVTRTTSPPRPNRFQTPIPIPAFSIDACRIPPQPPPFYGEAQTFHFTSGSRAEEEEQRWQESFKGFLPLLLVCTVFYCFPTGKNAPTAKIS